MEELSTATSDESEGTVVVPQPPEPSHRTTKVFWRRIIAFVLDGFVLGLVGLLPGLIFFNALTHVGGWGRLIGFAIALAYFGILNSTIGKGQTLGKRLMKVEVVDREGNHLSIGRSLLRYSIFGLPYFLNGAIMPGSVALSPVGYLIGFIVFVGGGSILYLYLFNRGTRQSLHDLAVGSFVTRRAESGDVAGTVWRPHIIIVGVIAILMVTGSVLLSGLTKKPFFADLIETQQAIESSGKVHTAGITAGKSWSKATSSGDSESTYLHVNAIWKGKPDDLEAATRELASLVVNNYKDLESKDVLSVSVSYGFDIGIARAWRSQQGRFGPADWPALKVAE